MKTSRSEIYMDLADYLQISGFSIMRKQTLNRELNTLFNKLYPRYYKNYYIKKEIGTAVSAGYEIVIPDQINKICEIILDTPGYLSATESTELLLPFRFSAWTETIRGDERVITFLTYDWYGTLIVTGTGPIEIPETTEGDSMELKIPSPEPLIHGLASSYYVRMKNRALAQGDRMLARTYENQSYAEMQLMESSAENHRMKHPVIRRGKTIPEQKQEYYLRYQYFTRLPLPSR